MTEIPIAKWGNSAAIRLPKAVMEELGLKTGQNVEQLFATLEQLPQTLQMVGQADAGAVSCGDTADTIDDRGALREQYAQMLVVVFRPGCFPPFCWIKIDVLGHFAVLFEKGRIARFKGRLEAKQLGFHAAGGNPVRKDAQGAQHLVQCRRQRLAGRLFVETQGTQQLQPAILADAKHPAPVAQSIEHLAQIATQQAGIEQFRQQAVTDPA